MTRRSELSRLSRRVVGLVRAIARIRGGFGIGEEKSRLLSMTHRC